MEIGPQSKSDSVFTKKCRKLQSIYRAETLKEPFCHGPNQNSKDKYGNILVNGEKSGLNFFDEYIFQYAKSKVIEKQINPDLTIDEYRLFNNMLSSMPMAFNLFGPLRRYIEDGNHDTTHIIKAVFPSLEWVDQVTYLDLEFIPKPSENYTNDKSAFDVMILAKDKKGQEGIISIETKYTDLLGKNSSSNRKVKDDLAEKENLFVDLSIFENGYSQLARNFLLTLAYKRIHKLKYFSHVVLSPYEDKHSNKEIDIFKQNLNKYHGNITKVELEDFVLRVKQSKINEYRKLINKFYIRYLDFSKVEN